MSDAPEAYVAGLLKGTTGIETPIAQIEGKWKVSQNRREADRAGVVAGLRGQGSMGDALADLVAEHSTQR